MMTKPFCRKCLLDELDEDEFIIKLKDYISSYPASQRCSEKEYKRRLDICKNCSRLSRGMCALCGCYVELRALKLNTFCPDSTDKWEV